MAGSFAKHSVPLGQRIGFICGLICLLTSTSALIITTDRNLRYVEIAAIILGIISVSLWMFGLGTANINAQTDRHLDDIKVPNSGISPMLSITSRPSLPLPLIDDLQSQIEAPNLEIHKHEKIGSNNPHQGSPLINPFTNDTLFTREMNGLNVRAFMIAKQDEELSGCEDSFAFNVDKRRYAVADGVGGSQWPRPWAYLLTSAFVNESIDLENEESCKIWLKQLAEKWKIWMKVQMIPFYHAYQNRNHLPLRNYQSELEKGAQATFIGCKISSHIIENQTDNKISEVSAQIFAIGDSDAFHFRRSEQGWQLLKVFPLDSLSQFNSHPPSLATKISEERMSFSWRNLRTLIFNPVLPGDLILLVTDSLSKWILANQGECCERITSLESQQAFEDMINKARMAGEIEDDDCTVLLITF